MAAHRDPRRRRILIAPDSFKGSLGPAEVAGALAEGWRLTRPADEIVVVPLADGGEGTLVAIAATAAQWRTEQVAAHDPLGRPLRVPFLRRDDEAVVELAAASGLSRLAADERDALAASTFGTGEVLAAAISSGARQIVMGLGGSASTDGGAGLLRALGARFRAADGADLPDGGGSLSRLASVDLRGLADALREVRLTIASDVTNPLLGPTGAAAVYGPQKGADDAQVGLLDSNLAHYADLLEATSEHEVRDAPGAGAAGGTGAGLLAVADRFAALAIRPGADVIMELAGFDHALATSDLVLSGEGRIDDQTRYGKTAWGVARRARSAGVKCICFCGGATSEGIAALAELDAVVVPVVERPMTLVEAMAAGEAPLVRAASRIARLVSLGDE